MRPLPFKLRHLQTTAITMLRRIKLRRRRTNRMAPIKAPVLIKEHPTKAHHSRLSTITSGNKGHGFKVPITATSGSQTSAIPTGPLTRMAIGSIPTRVGPGYPMSLGAEPPITMVAGLISTERDGVGFPVIRGLPPGSAGVTVTVIAVGHRCLRKVLSASITSATAFKSRPDSTSAATAIPTTVSARAVITSSLPLALAIRIITDTTPTGTTITRSSIARRMSPMFTSITGVKVADIVASAM